MPLPLLLALFLAFGFDGVVAGRADTGKLLPVEVATRAAETLGGVLLVAVVAFALGRLIAYRVTRRARASSRVRRAYVLGARVVDVLSVVVFAWIIHQVGWPRVAREGLGLGDTILLDEALVLLPFLLAQAAGWWGVYAAEHAIRVARGAGHPGGLGRHLLLKARQSMGMVLPVAAVYGLGTDLVHRAWPATLESRWDQPVSLALMGVLVLSLAPALVRIAWPTRPLPAGPLRDRLEHLARRVGFRCTDILVWDTNRVVVNAGVTGSLPWFRYVLLTDALVEDLEPLEIAAVFGHEVGHIAHRHLVYFGFFLLASLGLLAIGEGFLGQLVGDRLPSWFSGDSTMALVSQGLTALFVMGGYFLGIFGFLSRRFERQADVHGCRVVSCGLADCPPHVDLDSRLPDTPTPSLERTRARAVVAAMPLCPVGIGIFVGALTRVAMLNGMQPTAWSWRHGSIVRRIHFLESLVDRPEAERRFQAGVSRMRIALALALVGALGLLIGLSGGSGW